MAATLSLQVEMVGCPTVCRHCWAQGIPYPAMPVEDVAWVLEQTHRFCDDHGLGFGAYPMHELAAHPQAAAVLRLFADHVGAAEFEPLSTTGVPLAVHQDWPELLATAAALGTTTVWVTFHGLGVEHDRQVNRPGAFAETGLAIQRVHTAGLRACANVFLTTANAGQAERLLGTLQRLGVEEMAWEPATYYPTPRGRRNEPLRPRPPDLLPLSDQIRQLSPFHDDAWANLEAHTEAAWVARAVAGDWPSQLSETASRHGGQGLPLVCRPGLELHTGVAGGTASGTATCAATAPRPCSAAPWNRADDPSTRSGSGRTGSRRLRNWPPALATEPGRGCTSPKPRSATCGWTGSSEPDAPAPSSTRGSG